MSRWICPACDREFARERQSHICVPGCTVEESFAPWPAEWREIYDLLVEHLATLGPVHEDAVSVGVFLKNERKFAEVRPKARSLNLALVLDHPVRDPRFVRTVPGIAGRTWHFLKLTGVADVDDDVRGWLTDAYDAGGL
jgi:predicted transport protein